MKKFPKISIIIPLYVVIPRFFRDIKKFKDLDYPDYEILIVSDKEVKVDIPAKVILTGKNNTGPAEKRDIAIKIAKGKICVFIDDDAYPDKNWLKRAVRWFDNKNVVAVGGPGVTPKEDSFWQKISGYIVESYVCSGGVQYRYYPLSKGLKVVDYPAYNLFVLTKILRKVSGYGCNFYGGEDTFLCLKLIKFGDIVYDPTVLVYHHRRTFPVAHLKQIGNVGLHRGFFFRRYPATSRQIFYLLPTSLTLGFLSLLILSIVYPVYFLPLTLLGVVFFWALGAYSIKRHKVSLIESIIAGLGIILTHIIYGIYFLQGLASRDLKQ